MGSKKMRCPHLTSWQSLAACQTGAEVRVFGWWPVRLTGEMLCADHEGRVSVGGGALTMQLR